MKNNKHYYVIPGAVDFYGGTEDVVEVDPGIALVVQILNYKGYQTFASCSGHFKPGIPDTGYIWANGLDTVPVPKGMWVTENNRKSAIRWKVLTEIGFKRQMKKLENWALYLPFYDQTSQGGIT